MLVQENLKLFSPGHVSWNQSKQAFFPFEDLRTAITTRLRTQWDIHLEPSNLEFRYCDLEGDAFQVPNDWTVMQLLEEYRPDWRLRQYNYIESTLLVPGTSQPFVLRLRCHKVSPGVILPGFALRLNRKMNDRSFFSFDLRDFITTADFLGLHLSIHGLPIYSSCTSLPVCYYYSFAWHAFVTSAFGFFALSLFLRPFHPWSINVTQLWLAWVGLRIRTVDPLPQSLPQSQAARLLNYVIRLPRSYDLDNFGTSGSQYYTQRPRNHVPERYILSPCTSWCTFPYRAKSYLQFLPAPSLLITSGPPDPLQDHYALQQYQGVIHWRNSHLGALQMSWSWTLLLRSFWQLGVVPTHCGLLAPPLWDSSSTWAPSFSQCPHWDDFSCRGTPPNYQDPGVSQTTFRHLDGSYGIWRNQRHMENCWRHELPRRDPNTSTRSELPFWVKWPQLCTLASCRFICFDWLCQPRPRRSSKIKPRYMRGVCVCNIWTECKASFLILLRLQGSGAGLQSST